MSGSGVGGWNFMEENFNLPTLFFCVVSDFDLCHVFELKLAICIVLTNNIQFISLTNMLEI